MAVKEADTEEIIKETARHIFFVEGKLHATTQDIADAAGVNRALIHYYFRCREKLFEEVFNEALQVVSSRFHALIISETPFREKISRFIELMIEQNLKYPYLESFLITEINREPSKQLFVIFNEIRSSLLPVMSMGLKEEIRKGNVARMTVEQFLTNLIALCAYPTLAKPMMLHFWVMDEKSYQSFIEERKRLIMSVMFKD